MFKPTLSHQLDCAVYLHKSRYAEATVRDEKAAILFDTLMAASKAHARAALDAEKSTDVRSLLVHEFELMLSEMALDYAEAIAEAKTAWRRAVRAERAMYKLRDALDREEAETAAKAVPLTRTFAAQPGNGATSIPRDVFVEATRA